MDNRNRRNARNGTQRNANNNRNQPNYRNKENTTKARKYPNKEVNKNIPQAQNKKSNIDRGRKNAQYFNFTRLNDLITKSDENVMAFLRDKEIDFQNFLSNEMNPDVIVLTVKVLVKVSQAPFTDLVTRTLALICSTKFLGNLENYLLKLPVDDEKNKTYNDFYYSDVNRFWSDLLELFKKIVELIPRTAWNKLTPVLQKIVKIFKMIESMQNYKIDDTIKDAFSTVLKDMEENIEMMNEKDLKNSTAPVEFIEKEENPPEDFRMLSVIPTREDLFEEKPFLRACKIDKPYDSIEHYLDVQFRLLREDFVKPLRNGIKEYIEERKSRNSDFRIYKNVKLIPFDNKENNVGIKLSFGKLKNVDWKRSKRLMFGSLLLLSMDNFITVLFVTVSDRNVKELEEGRTTIELCEGTTITPDIYQRTFIMLESKIYFEPYFEVLTAMKNINASNFPMETYFVEAQTGSILPNYLRHEPVLTFNKYLYLPTKVTFGRDLWPSADRLNMDESQYNAFKSAITQEFAVIQGPPGTGKTFLALEIVRTLLENKEHWLKYGPIVVVCLTNHALDQFLEGILRQQSTKSIVRVGSRSKSEALKPYSLMERRKLVAKRSISNSLFYKTKHELEDILGNIQKMRSLIQFFKSPKTIVPLECLKHCCDDQFLRTFKSNTDLINWLIGVDLSTLFTKYSLFEETKSISEIDEEDSEEEFEDAENKHTDNDILLDTSRFNDSSMESINLFNIFDKELMYIDECMRNAINYVPNTQQEHEKREINLRYMERDRVQLLRIRMFLDDQLKHHPLLNPTAVVQNDFVWAQYWTWIKSGYDRMSQLLFALEEDFRKKDSELKDIRQLANTEILKEHEIIGLTTTCAAKLQSSLRSLRAPIVLVEEAAEILEAHVVCSMTKHCQHVILIGDHKQLRPKASVYELGTKYHLNISLFERMVRVRGKCTQLTYQHRMRPEIAKLITPSIYETLYNHNVVLKYPDVLGVEKNVFFLDHSHKEENYKNEESYKNDHEVNFFLAFAKHLLLQGYTPSEITILCTYTGQLFTFMNEVKRNALLRQIRITTVDNYQGEENKIILLSLVRNNRERNIGFLKEENRVCVALSRAKEGLYIMGNMDNLVHKNTIWPKIRDVLKENNAIGESFKLKCQLHDDQRVEVKEADDFKKCPEGGCSKKCDLLLSCGHLCTSVCHILDREHKEYRCTKNCVNEICPRKHLCPLKCWEKCQPCQVKVPKLLDCGHTVDVPCSVKRSSYSCPVQVEVTLPECKHIMTKPCYLPVSLCKCTHNCEIRLPCGHSCNGKCHARTDPDHLEYHCMKDCARKNVDCSQDHTCRKRCFEKCEPCAVLVDKTRSCGHLYKKIPCSSNVEEHLCKRRCDKKLTCGHTCRLKCCEDCKNCPEKVIKKSSCGHDVTVKCCEEATPLKCSGKCPKLLPCGHQCTKKCKDPCTAACKILVELKEPGLCGHLLKVPCYLRNTDPKSTSLLKYCAEPCTVQLACEHQCKGSCGKCFQGRFHFPCGEPCRKVFLCGHNCEILCEKECQPCLKDCELRCSHSKCNKKCGQPCPPCKQPCDWGCEHRRCTKRCHELCDVKPCNEPCQKTLNCGHPCVGFCGDPCPPLCRICNKDELTEMFFGNEDDEDARFVLLPDCKHCIENEGLLKWIEISTEPDESVEIKTPTCPKCKTPINNCMRIMNDIKKSLMDVTYIKERNFSSNRKDLIEKQIEYLKIIETVINKPDLNDFLSLKNYCRTIYKLGNTVKNNRKQVLNHIELNVFKNIVDLINEIVALLESLRIKPNATFEFISNQVVLLLESLPNDKFQMSKQRLDDVQLEMRRLHLMVQIYNEFSEFGIHLTEQKEYKISMNYVGCQDVMNMLCCIKRFTQIIEKYVISLFNGLSKNKIKIEREMIVKAIGLAKGHWFKCPNGHFYAIGECGGAMQQGKCIECNATIGGTNHHLVSNNALATEMDGATRHAYEGGLY